MLNYHDEIKNDILDVLEEDENARNILQSENCIDMIIDNLTDYLIDCDDVTGNLSGSYYFNSKEARKHCYNYASDVKEALEMYGYKKELELFEVFEDLADEGYIDVDTMKLDDDTFYEEEAEYRWCIVNNFETIEELNFEFIDVITRCYMLYEVVLNIVKSFLK